MTIMTLDKTSHADRPGRDDLVPSRYALRVGEAGGRGRIDGCGKLARSVSVSRALANASTNAQYLRSSNLARSSRWMTAKTIAVETPNMSAPFAASSGPNNRQD